MSTNIVLVADGSHCVLFLSQASIANATAGENSSLSGERFGYPYESLSLMKILWWSFYLRGVCRIDTYPIFSIAPDELEAAAVSAHFVQWLAEMKTSCS